MLAPGLLLHNHYSMRLILTFTLLAAALPAQTRPKVGLVLEGGGALGFAHIGVLQWLEDHRIPVDYVAGTSMGGLIGGLYASGQRPQEIRELARTIDWDKTMSGVPALQDLNFRRKEDRIDYPTRLNFGLKGGLSLPAGLNSGQEIGLILDRAVLPYFELKSFDDLPIPFRCVGTEMVSGTQAIFDKGSLAQALRATMSIPAVFAPVVDGGKIYTDGGALNNLPVDVAKKMGADIIIAVYLNPGVDDPKTFNSLLGAAARNIAIMIAANELRSMEQADILLSADLKGFTSSQFGRSEEIFPKGVEAAKKKSALLERLALSEAEWRDYIAARQARRRTAVPEPKFVAVDGTAGRRKRGLEEALANNAGKPVDAGELATQLRKLQGSEYFDSLSYGMASANGEVGLAVHAVEKTYAPPFLNLSVNLDGVDTNDIRFGMSARATFFDVGGYASELRLEGFFGSENGLRGEYFHPLTESSRWFVAPRAYSSNRNFEVYSNRLRISQYRLGDDGLAVDLGYSLSRRAEIRFGEALEWQRGKLRIGIPLVPDGSYHRTVSSARFRYFGQDDAVVPRKGVVLQSELKGVPTRPNSADGYVAASAKISYFAPAVAKGSLFFTASGGTAFGARNLAEQSFALGGPLSLGAYGRNELLGNQFYLLQGGYLHELFKMNPLIGDALYVAGFYELGKMYGPVFPNTPRNPMDLSGVVVVKTLFGPAFVGGSVSPNGRAKWWFGLGRVF